MLRQTHATDQWQVGAYRSPASDWHFTGLLFGSSSESIQFNRHFMSSLPVRARRPSAGQMSPSAIIILSARAALRRAALMDFLSVVPGKAMPSWTLITKQALLCSQPAPGTGNVVASQLVFDCHQNQPERSDARACSVTVDLWRVFFLLFFCFIDKLRETSVSVQIASGWRDLFKCHCFCWLSSSALLVSAWLHHSSDNSFFQAEWKKKN